MIRCWSELTVTKMASIPDALSVWYSVNEIIRLISFEDNWWSKTQNAWKTSSVQKNPADEKELFRVRFFFPVCTCRRSCYVVYYQRDVHVHGRASRLYLGAKIHVLINVLTFGGGVCTPSTSGRVKLWNSYLCRLNLCNS